MKPKTLHAELLLKAEFYDVDSMRIVWHGNYVKFLEQARCKLLDDIGFNYDHMETTGFAWPIVSVQLKYVKPIRFNQHFLIRASLEEYEHRLKIRYLILDPETGRKINTAESVQMAVDVRTGESQLVSPPCLIEAVERRMRDLGVLS